MERVKDQQMTPGTIAGRDGDGDSGATSERSMTNSPKIKEYDTPPDHVNDVVSDPLAALSSPASGRSRGQLRASSLGTNPSIARAMNGSPTRRRGSKLVPPPISVGQQAGIPLQLPGFSSLPHSGDSLGAQPVARRLQAGTENLPFGKFEPNALTARNPRDINPYLHRADEIGPTHRIPGIGHLGSALVPPGWKIGDDLISPEKAQQLYEEARRVATDNLDTPMSDEDWPDEEREKRQKAIDRKWTSTFKKDELVLKERVEIYRQNQLRRQTMELAKAFSQSGASRPMLESPLPQSPKPQFGVSPRSFQSSMQNTDAGAFRPPPSPRDMMSMNGQMSPGGLRSTRVEGPQSRYPPTGTLDPALITESVAATIIRYRQQQEEIVRKKEENEQLLGAFLNQYKTELTGPISPAIRSPITGMGAGPFSSIHHGHVPTGAQQPSPRPLPYVSPTRSRFTIDARPHVPTSGDCPTSISLAGYSQQVGRPAVPVSADSIANRYRSTSEGSGFAQGNGGHYSQGSAVETNRTASVTPAEKRKRATKCRSTKKEPVWYADRMVGLPVSQISAESMAFGEAWRKAREAAVTDASTQVPKLNNATRAPKKTPKKRGKVFDPDPAKAMGIGHKECEMLVNRGLLKVRRVPGPFPVDASNPTIADNALPASEASKATYPGNPVLPTHSQSTVAYASLSTTNHQPSTIAPGLLVDSGQPSVRSASDSNKVAETVGGVKSKLDNEGEGDEGNGDFDSESSLDDPTDESWGSRKRNTTPRKSKPTGPRAKRSKSGKDGFNDSNNGSNVPPCMPAFTSIAIKPTNKAFRNPYGPS